MFNVFLCFAFLLHYSDLWKLTGSSSCSRVSGLLETSGESFIVFACQNRDAFASLTFKHPTSQEKKKTRTRTLVIDLFYSHFRTFNSAFVILCSLNAAITMPKHVETIKVYKVNGNEILRNQEPERF